MSTILELLDEASERIKDLKTMAVAEAQGRDERPEIRPTVMGWRGGDPVVLAIPAQIDRDQALLAARMAATGFGCDAISFAVDTWGTQLTTNPVTGREWDSGMGGGVGSMQDVVLNHQGLEKGWIYESLSTFVVNRAGDLVSNYQPFTLTKATTSLGIVKWTLEWGDEIRGDLRNVDEHAEGVIPEALVRMMNEPTMLQEMARRGLRAHDFGIDDTVETLAHADCGVVKSLRIYGGWEGALMLMSNDPRRAEIIERSLGVQVL